MGNFSAKSILLGMGIGIILTATVSMIYLSGRDPVKELTEQQIVSQAEKYGMVKVSVLQTDTPENVIFASGSAINASVSSEGAVNANDTGSIRKAKPAGSD